MIGVGGSVIGGSQMRELQHAVSEQIATECGDDHDDDGPAVNRDQPAECVEPAGREFVAIEKAPKPIAPPGLTDRRGASAGMAL